MTAGRWALTIAGAVVVLLVFAIIGAMMLSRHDVETEVQGITGIKPAVWLVGVPSDGGNVRLRYTVMATKRAYPVHMDWHLWPFRQIRLAPP